MDSPPTNPRVTAMLAVLFGKDWEQLEGDVAFEKGPMDAWVNAIESMLNAADAVDPIRVAFRELMQETNSSETAGSPFPTRADV